MTAPPPSRIVDAHVHLWDPARTDWYPYLSGRQDIGMGDTTGMERRFDVSTYRAEAGDRPVTALVNVAAATGGHSVAETLELDRRAAADPDGQPAALVGGLPPADTTAGVVEAVDAQMAAGRLRGVRPMGLDADPLPAAEVLRALADRGLVFELMTHPHRLRAAAEGLAAVDGLAVVVEHTGWPRSDAPEERALWAEGMAALAAVGDRVTCKLSGLAMPLRAMSAGAFRPWIETAIGLFGAERCLFASNFPVDGMVGGLDRLWSVYDEVTSGLPASDREALFAGTAERVYRLG
jgi:L-fuconolactonase